MTDSLFVALFRKKLSEHNRTEDFLTEIFAWMMKRDDEFRDAMLERLLPGVFNAEGSYVIETQKRYSALPGHDRDSIIDIVVRRTHSTRHIILFIESKVESVESYKQLNRYAQHLDNIQDADHRYLLFLTKNNIKPKIDDILFGVASPDVHFEHKRWYDVYDVLRHGNVTMEWPNNDLMKFLENYDMTMPTTFSPEILVTMNQMPESIRFMDKLLNDITYAVKKIGKPIRPSSRSTQLVRQRYIDAVHFDKQLWFGIGFFMRPDLGEYPQAALFMEAGPNSPMRDELINFARNLAATSGRESDPTEVWTVSQGDWSGVKLRKSLQIFMSSSDSVNEVKKFFINGVDIFSNAMKEWPSIEWHSTGDAWMDE